MVKRLLPALLTTLRLLLGPLMLAFAFAGTTRWVFAPMLIIGTLSDIYDGILARRFGVSTPALRRYDSGTDVVYYIFVFASAWLLCRDKITNHWGAIGILVFSEIASILTSFLRFHRFPATHSYLAKLYGLALLACFLGLLAFDAPGWTIDALAVTGLLANLEIVAILLISSSPPVDVKSVLTLLGQNKSKRHRITS